MDIYSDIVIRSLAIYLFILLAIRIFGKKELTQLSVSDLVLILLISNAVQNAMVGPDTSLLGGITAAAALFVINYLFKLTMYRFPFFSNIIEGKEVMLIYKGKVLDENLRKEKITVNELMAAVREHGVSSIEHVEIAVFERDGNISVVSAELTGQTFHTRPKRHVHPRQHKRG